MNRTAILMVVLVALCPGFVAAAHGAQASCLMRVTYDSHTLPLDPASLEALLASDGILSAAAREVPAVVSAAEEDEVPVNELVLLETRPMGHSNSTEESLFMMYVGIETHGRLPQAEAEAVLRGVCARFEALLHDVGQEDRARLEQKAEHAEIEAREALERMRELQLRQQSLCEQAGRYDLSRQRVVHEIDNWRRERDELALKLEAERVGRKMAAEEIAQIGQKIEQRIAEDEVLREMEELVRLYREQLQVFQQQVEAGVATPGEAVGIKERVVQSQLRVMEHKEMVSRMVGAERLAHLNERLLASQGAMYEIEARLQKLDEMLAHANEAHLLELATLYEGEVKLQIELAKRAALEAAERQRDVGRRLREYSAPRVTVLGGPAAD